MKDPRLWTVVLAVTWFLLGLGVGHLAYRDRGGGDHDSARAQYGAELCRVFDLDSLRRSALYDLLEQRDIQREAVRRRHEARTRALMEPALREIDESVERTIRDTILPPAKRVEFDRLTAPLVMDPLDAERTATGNH